MPTDAIMNCRRFILRFLLLAGRTARALFLILCPLAETMCGSTVLLHCARSQL
jgi:hypothetical protein